MDWVELQLVYVNWYPKYVQELLHGLPSDTQPQHYPRILNGCDDRRHLDGPCVDRNKHRQHMGCCEYRNVLDLC